VQAEEERQTHKERERLWKVFEFEMHGWFFPQKYVYRPVRDLLSISTKNYSMKNLILYPAHSGPIE
jgi:hypothetical protein